MQAFLSLFLLIGAVLGQLDSKVTQWQLMSTVTDTVISNLEDGTTIEANSIQNFGFNALTSPSPVTCVQFFLDSEQWTSRELNAPYTIPGDDGGNLPSFNIAVGKHNFTGRVTSQPGDNNNPFGDFGPSSTVVVDIVQTDTKYFGSSVLQTSGAGNSNVQILSSPVNEDSLVQSIQILLANNINDVTGSFDIKSFARGENNDFKVVAQQSFTLSTDKRIPTSTKIDPPFRVNAGQFVGIVKTGGLPLPVNNPRTSGSFFFVNSGDPTSAELTLNQQNQAPAWRIEITNAPALPTSQTTSQTVDDQNNVQGANSNMKLDATMIGIIVGVVGFVFFALLAAIIGGIFIIRSRRGSLCARCDSMKATIGCVECKVNFCANCFSALHKGTEWEQHEAALLYKNK